MRHRVTPDDGIIGIHGDWVVSKLLNPGPETEGNLILLDISGIYINIYLFVYVYCDVLGHQLTSSPIYDARFELNYRSIREDGKRYLSSGS